MSKKEVQLAISLFEAIDDENFSNIVVLLEKYHANPNAIIPKLGISPLHYAAGFENLNFAEKVIEIFLKKGCLVNEFSECDAKLTALHIACLWNRPKIVKMLLERGARLDLMCNEGQTAIEYAIMNENFEVIEVIKKFVFEQKIEKKKQDLLQSQAITPKRNFNVTSPRTPKINSNEEPPTTPVKNSLTNALQRIERDKFTPNRINYNFDVSSPYYINITHRRKHRAKEMDDNEKNEKKAENFEDLCSTKKNLFELTQKNLKEFSKHMRKAIVVERIAIHKRRSYIVEWQKKIQQIRKDNDFVDKSYLNYLHECDNAEIISSTCSSDDDDGGIYEIKSSSDSFVTAESDLKRCHNALADDAFIEKTYQGECIENILEHSDVENGIVFYERNLKNFANAHSDGESSLSTIISIPLDYDTDTLKDELKSFGRKPGPITKSTKRLYLKQLMKFKKHPERLGIVEEEENDPSRITYPLELQRTLTNYDHLTENIKDYLSLETRMVNHFLEKAHLKWREGNSKTSFVYLLLDPRVTEKLAVYHTQLTKREVWAKFLKSIFYIGKGKRARPYQHLYDAIKIYSNGQNSHDTKTSESKKISRIIDIWKDDHGVVCLLIFNNIMPAEAFTREASLIDTLGIHNLTNLKKGEYYGASTCYTMRQKRQMGVALLFRALHMYLAEGESQLKPCDF